MGGRRRRRRAGAAEGPALCLRGGREQPRSGQGQRSLFAHADPAHLRGPLHLRPPGAAGEDQAAHRRRHAEALGRLPRLDGARSSGHLLREGSGVQGQAARARRPGLRLRVEALRRPCEQEPGVVGHGDGRLRRPARGAPACARPEEAVRLRPGDRRHPRDRPLHDPLHAEGAAAAIRRDDGGRRPLRRGRARGDRVLRCRGRVAPGRHRPIQARPVAAQLAHRLRAQSRFPRDALRRRARRRRRRRPGAARALQGAPPTDGRPRRDLDHRGRAAALAFVRQRRSRCRLPRRLPVRAAGDAERQGRAELGQERDPRLSDRRGGEQLLPLQHGRPGGRRLQRRPGGAAARDRPRPRLQEDHRLRLQRARHGLAGADAAAHDGVRPEPQDRVQRLRPGARAGVARPLRIHRQERRRLA